MAAMASFPASDPLRFLTDWPTSKACSRPVPGWSAHPVLSRFDSAGTAAQAAATDPVVFAALAGRAEDPTVATALLSAVAIHLRPIVGRWRAAGVRGADLDDAVADLVAWAVAELQSGGRPDARQVAWRAWQRTYHPRRSERRHAERQVPFDRHTDIRADESDGLRSVLSILADALAGGTLTVTLATSLWATACGWPAVDAAHRAGVSAEAWRARTHRAARALRQMFEAEGGE